MLAFNQKRHCGLWLLIIGVVIAISVFFGGQFCLNPLIFMVGYGVGFYITYFNKRIRTWLSDGELSAFQNRMTGIGIICLCILIFFLGGSFIPSWNWRMIWLGVLLATGIHFFVFYFVHGKNTIYLGLLCSLSAVAGIVFSDIPFSCWGYLDALIKTLFGLYLLFLSNPSTSKKQVKGVEQAHH